MNGMFANSRGLSDLAKHLHFAGCVRDHDLDFLAISETGKREFSQSLLNRLSGGIEFDWYLRLSPWSLWWHFTGYKDKDNGSVGCYGWRFSYKNAYP